VSAPASKFPSTVEVLPNNIDSLSYMGEDLDELEDITSAQEKQPEDLDKTWLDKLISFMSEPFGA